jgi:hypothetical protein
MLTVLQLVVAMRDVLITKFLYLLVVVHGALKSLGPFLTVQQAV